MTYRIIKEDDGYKIQEKGLSTLFVWNTWSKYGGSFGNEDYVYQTIEEAESAIKRQKEGKVTTIVKIIR